MDLEDHLRKGESGECPNRDVRCRRDWIGNRVQARLASAPDKWSIGVVEDYDPEHSLGRLRVRFDKETVWLNAGALYNKHSVLPVKGDIWRCGWVIASKRKEHESSENQCNCIPVRCELGCGMTIMKHAKEDHEKFRCPFRLVQCECEEMVPLKRLGDHKAELCPRRPTECPDCEKVMPYSELFEHQRTECTMIHERCPLACGKKIRRCRMDKHLSSQCLKRVVTCKWGCGKEMFADAALNHENVVCELRQVPCPKGCGESVIWNTLDNHVKEHCINRIIDCPQCARDVLFKNLETHLIRGVRADCTSATLAVASLSPSRIVSCRNNAVPFSHTALRLRTARQI